MARDWVATSYARVILDVSFRVFYLPVWVLAKFASCVRSLVRIWSHNKWPDRYGHATQLCSYVFGHLSADHTYMVMLHKYLRTCMVTLQQTRRVWLHDVSALVRVWLFSNWPDTYGHKTQLCPYVSGHITNGKVGSLFLRIPDLPMTESTSEQEKRAPVPYMYRKSPIHVCDLSL